MPGVKAATQLIRFDMAGFAVSAGSACSSGTLKSSHVLEAIRTPAELATCAIRVSVGWSTTPDHLAAFAESWTHIAHDARSRAA